MSFPFFLRQSKDIHSLEEIDIETVSDERFSYLFRVFSSSLEEILLCIGAFFKFSIILNTREKFNEVLKSRDFNGLIDMIESGDEADKEKIRQNKQLVVKATLDEFATKKYEDEIYEKSKKLLMELTDDKTIQTSNDAILRQSIVMLWSAAENLIREVFRVYLNKNPKKSKCVFDDQDCNKYWSQKGMKFDLLANHDFKLENNMGDVALSIHEMNSPSAMLAGYSALFGKDSNIVAVLRSDDFYNLFKLRNLIVHRSGYVDEKFIKETKYDYEIGQLIQVSVNDFNIFFGVTKKIVKIIARSGF